MFVNADLLKTAHKKKSFEKVAQKLKNLFKLQRFYDIINT